MDCRVDAIGSWFRFGMALLGAMITLFAPMHFAHAKDKNTYIATSAVVDICRSAHREGYTRLYDYLGSQAGENLSLGWWPDPELTINESELIELNRVIVQFKNPINAVAAQLLAPVVMRETELEFKDQYPRLSHFIISLAVKAKDAGSAWLKTLDVTLKDNSMDQDNGLRDARRHAVWGALMSRYLGPRVAFCALSLHEVDNTWNPQGGIFEAQTPVQANGTVMDFYNNAVGVAIGATFVGTDKELVQHVEQLIAKGDLVVLNFQKDLTSSKWWMEAAIKKRDEKYRKSPVKTFIKEHF